MKRIIIIISCWLILPGALSWAFTKELPTQARGELSYSAANEVVAHYRHRPRHRHPHPRRGGPPVGACVAF